MSAPSPVPSSDRYDVVICGGGIAGLTLARQLHLTQPDLRLLVIDKLKRPLPLAAFKVGESSVEASAHYLAKVLELGTYWTDRHLLKLGLRFFFGDSQGPLEARPEFGISKFPPIQTYQIDRGVLENDLRDMLERDGVPLWEGYSVAGVTLSPDGTDHQVTVTGPDGEPRSVACRWVIDALGRRRLLQRQLGLEERTVEETFSAAWFRMKGRIDLCDLVPDDASVWHDRVPGRIRYHSTNHLMGEGYWVWLIPLSSGSTSLGIVADESIHPLRERTRYDQAYAWLLRHEPLLARYLAGREIEDFRVLKDYGYGSKQVFSVDRWACTGDAGVFADPFFSPGIFQVGLGNSIITEMIRRDREGSLTPEAVDDYNGLYLMTHRSIATSTALGYRFHKHGMVMAAKMLWDLVRLWAVHSAMFLNGTHLDPHVTRLMARVSARYYQLTQVFHRLLTEWAALSPGRLTFDFIDYRGIPCLDPLYKRSLRTDRTLPELIEDQRRNTELLEELVQVIFRVAVEDVRPELLPRLPAGLWLNAWAVGLDSERWEAEGLFRPATRPRDLSAMWADIRGHFRPRDPVAPDAPNDAAA